MSAAPLYGAIEAGGTKFVLAVGSGPDDLRDVVRVPTGEPAETLAECVSYFQMAGVKHGPLAGVGVATFGPAGVTRGAADYGFITTTPKPGWQHTDVAGTLQRALGVPVAFDTDVNGAALAEWRWGAGQGCGVVLYITVGTGIGGGVVIDGRPLHGLLHPEMGHLQLPRAEGDTYAGCCPWHGDCLEGMASGPALAGRWGTGVAGLPLDHAAWELEAHYLAHACVNFILTLSPQRIILGGGVMDQPLLPAIRRRVQSLLAGYLQHPLLEDGLESWIVAPGLGNRSGILGAIALNTLPN